MKHIILCFVAATAMLLLLSASNVESPTGNLRYIDVVGSAEMLVEPNEVYFSIELKEVLKGKTKITLDSLEQQLYQAMNDAALPNENLSVVKFNAAQYYKNRKNNEFLGTKSFKLKINSPAQLNSFFLSLGDSDIRNIYYQYSSHTDYIQLRDSNKVAAIKAAHTKAVAMVEAVGGMVGLPLFVVEGTGKAGVSAGTIPKALGEEIVGVEVVTASKIMNTSSYDYNSNWNTYNNYNSSYTTNANTIIAAGNDISFEKIRFYQEVQVRFEIVAP